MVRTESQADANIYHRITGYNTILQSVADTFIDRRDEFARNHTTFNFIDKFIACTTRLHRFHFDHNMTILTFTTRLFNVFGFGLHFLTDSLAVGYLRRTYVGFHTKFAFHAVHNNFQVQFAHTGNNGLAGLFISTHTERRVFLSQAVQGNTHFFLVGFGFRLNGNVDYRLREFHAFQNNRCIFGSQSFTGGYVFQTDGGGNVAGTHFIDLVTVVRSHLHQTADTFASTLYRVHHAVARLQHA